MPRTSPDAVSKGPKTRSKGKDSIDQTIESGKSIENKENISNKQEIVEVH
jgi:hypothetical protein